MARTRRKPFGRDATGLIEFMGPGRILESLKEMV